MVCTINKGYDDLDLFKRYASCPFSLGLGVIDVKSPEVETADMVARRVKMALEILPPDRVMVNPDCGRVFPWNDLASLESVIDSLVASPNKLRQMRHAVAERARCECSQRVPP